MTDSEYNRLREFGKKVQSTAEGKEEVKRKISFYSLLKNIETKAMKWFQIIRSVISQIFLSCSKFVKRLVKRIKNKSTFLKGNFRLDQRSKRMIYSVDEEPRVIVEYQKQWMNTSIIIRRRKKKYAKNASEDAIPLPSSKSIAYYFHRIDTQEKERKTSFSPRFSLWDFPYKKQDSSLINWVKRFFH